MTLKILVADKIAEEGLALLRQTPDLTFDERPGLAPADLAPLVADYDGMLIRSSVQITKEVLARPGRLRVIARAGVGVDNVDVPTATAAGVLVLNTPDANTLSTAEHTIAMIMAVMRHIPAAHAHVAAGGWDRKAFVGRQLAGKTLGIIGLGRVGRAVAQRALALEMKILAHDPLIGGDTAMDGRVALVPTIKDLLPRVDALTLHATLTSDTRHLIGAPELAAMKPTAILINCARGALVDEHALAEALTSGRLAAAAIDVFAEEPPKSSPLLACKNAVLTPHLGASTEEAQTAVSIDAAQSLLDYLLRGSIRNGVNVGGLPSHLSPRDRAQIDLVSRLGAILAPLCADGVDAVEVAVHGDDKLAALAPTLALAAMVDLMNPHIEGRLNLVNAHSFAVERGIRLLHSAHSPRPPYPETVAVRCHRRGEARIAEGAVFADSRPRLLAIDGYRMEIMPEGLLVMIFNDDRPGVIGLVGKLLGDHHINIGDMALSRRDKTALMLLKIDGPVPAALLDELRKSPPILAVHRVSLPPLGA